VEFRVLGPLEVTEGGAALALGGPRQRVVLAYLILEANRVVSTDQLIDRIWGDEPPEAARAALFAYVSRLRKLLGAGRIQARPPGYILVAEPGEIDALRFASLLDEARRSGPDGEAAAGLLLQALELWRGSALSDLADYDALRPAITRLEELRLGALEDRIEAEIQLGRHREVVPQLESLTGEYPLRERLWIQLILALYRSGRQGDALGAYHRARTMLVEELGIDPSPALRRLETQVLNQDPALERTLPSPSEGGGTAPAPSDQAAEPPAARAAADRGRAGGRRRRTYLLAGAVLGLAALATVVWVRQDSGGLPPNEWKVAVVMPFSGYLTGYGEPIRDAVQLAVDEINAAGGVEGSTLVLVAHDEPSTPKQAAGVAREFADDPSVVAMIGPFRSAMSFAFIPITNEAGLLQCSPSNTHPGLTKPRDGALDLRASRPDAINYIRLAPADDIQAVALASFAFRDLHVRSALVIDDTDTGRVIADPFEKAFQQLGGRTIRLALNPGADPRTVLASLDDPLGPPGLVFFGGMNDTGGWALRKAMAETGHGSTPLLTWDALLNGDGSDSSSYIGRVGIPGAVGSYAAHASLPDHKASFADAYRQEFGSEPDEYSAAGYACVQIIVAAMRGIAAQGPAFDEVRDLIRAFAVDPSRRYETVLGTVGFDANGDALQQFVTFYRVEASAAQGAGDWVIFKKQDYGPAP
jgi:DNA-binding SARP family transcriptional activator/ABC-type branched-subunit amino acid transport system substrate-binding protein